MKKLFASFLIAVFIISGVSCGPHANPASDFTYEITENTVAITQYIGSDTSVVIPDEIEGLPVCTIGENAFTQSNVEEVTIPASVQEYSCAFLECNALKKVRLQKGLKLIDDSAFYACAALEEIEIPESIEKIGINAFAFSGLKKVKLPKNLQTLEGYAFYRCPALEEVHLTGDIQNWLFDRQFAENPALTTVILDEGVTQIGPYSFISCTALESVTFPKSLTDLGVSAFSGCSSMKSVTFLGDKPEDLEGYTLNAERKKPIIVYYDPAAKGWEDAEIEDLVFRPIGTGNDEPAPVPTAKIEGDFEYEMIKDMAVITKYTGSDSRLVLPDKIDGFPVRIEATVFSESQIEEVTIPAAIKDYSYAFRNCKTLKTVHLQRGIKTISSGAFSHCPALEEIEIPESVESIGVRAFEYSGLKRITIPGTVKTVDVQAFHYCSALEEVRITGNIESWGNTGNGHFAGNTALTSLILEEGVTTLGNSMFYKCTALETVTFPKSLKKLGDAAFVGCSGLKSVTFLGDRPEGLDRFTFGVAEKPVTVYYDPAAKGWENAEIENLIFEPIA